MQAVTLTNYYGLLLRLDIDFISVAKGTVYTPPYNFTCEKTTNSIKQQTYFNAAAKA